MQVGVVRWAPDQPSRSSPICIKIRADQVRTNLDVNWTTLTGHQTAPSHVLNTSQFLPLHLALNIFGLFANSTQVYLLFSYFGLYQARND